MNDELQDKKVHKIEKIEKLDVSKQLEAVQVDSPEEVTVAKTKFDSAVQKADNNWVDARTRASQVAEVSDPTLQSPMDQLGMAQKKIQRLEPATADKLIASAEKLQGDMRVQIDRLDAASKQMPPDAKLSPLFEAPLSERLVHIDSSLRSALGIVGSEVKGPAAPPSTVETAKQGPLVKFLSYLAHGDAQLKSVVGEIQGMQTEGAEKISPAKLMAVQIKLTFVQQELEFFTNVLNKALESTKTIMNVQV